MNSLGVIRAIIAIGAGIMITTVIGSFVCLNMTPILLNQCVKTNQEVLDFLFIRNGFITQLIGTTGGAFTYYLTGKWNRN